MKLVLVLLITMVSNFAFAQASTDTPPWKKIAEEKWMRIVETWQGDAIVTIERKGEQLLYTVRAICNSKGVYFLEWTRGQKTASGFDCDGKDVRLPIRKLRRLTSPPPKDLLEKQKNDAEEPVAPKALMRLV